MSNAPVRATFATTAPTILTAIAEIDELKGRWVVPWLTFFLQVLRSQAQMAVALLSDANFEKTLSPNQLAVWRYLQTVAEASPLEIAQQAQVARPTVSQVINKFLDLQKVERIGQGRAVRYRLVRIG